mmetsp:Transcript_21627/g.21933  ORF Transcript_21627/g.21933 Transcript_21627/m.21933 type:complete len:107 (+) Transcript_21627:212-532(+)
MARKAGYKGVPSMIIQNSYSKLLPECFGKSTLAVVTRVPLPRFHSFEYFDTHVQSTSWKHNTTLRVKAQAKVLKSLVRDEIKGAACNMAIECINAAELCQPTSPLD